MGFVLATLGSATQSYFVPCDLRKFAEKYGDIIQWDQSNRAYIMTHGVSGIDWKHYKHPLPEHIYNVYANIRNRLFKRSLRSRRLGA